ncbi:thioredoxin [Hymenobacter sp. RP-2-7]|uniref:Thioredoxin n=1 Tax=Hymenobacter polaris TaxID=2682546 RepID=A0A7Y0FKS2_9BACT|nr:thioredoxin [Hymenobacter polaris]NML63855.1 thioredoxin [Hymenobacter polaris]
MLPPQAAVLLVLLPLVAGGLRQQAWATATKLRTALQHRLGAAIQVLVVEEENDPVVVRSFRAASLPTFVLVRHGIELWRQAGLPEGEAIAEQLLRLAGSPPTPGSLV